MAKRKKSWRRRFGLGDTPSAPSSASAFPAWLLVLPVGAVAYYLWQKQQANAAAAALAAAAAQQAAINAALAAAKSTAGPSTTPQSSASQQTPATQQAAFNSATAMTQLETNPDAYLHQTLIPVAGAVSPL